MNWGWSLALVYCAFVGVMLSFVFRARQEKIDLVAPDYYARELLYQQRMEAISNARSYMSAFGISKNAKEVTIQLPAAISASAQGTIHFYCPSDNKKDKDIAIKLDTNAEQNFTLSEFAPARYEIQCEWTNNGTPYFIAQTLHLP